MRTIFHARHPKSQEGSLCGLKNDKKGEGLPPGEILGGRLESWSWKTSSHVWGRSIASQLMMYTGYTASEGIENYMLDEGT